MALPEEAAGLMLIRETGFVSILPSDCECRSDVVGDWTRGCGDGTWTGVGFGDEVPDAEGEAEGSGAVDEGREMEGPPSFANRLARICTRLSSAGLFGREPSGSCTLSASDMAVSCSGGGGSVIS